MIQDIAPYCFDNTYAIKKAEDDDLIVIFDKDKVLCRITDDKVIFPAGKDLKDQEFIYLFRIDNRNYFTCEYDMELTNFSYCSLRQIRDSIDHDEVMLFGLYTAYHLSLWYKDNRYCGCCGERLKRTSDERALECPNCHKRIYPRINPAVIVGVKNGDRLLITKYARGFAHNALVAGFTEIGETFEDTVRREVREEAGIRVKNISYYKSQPWGVAQDILAGFYCEVDGDDTITMDNRELKYASWVKREDIELQPTDYSLTNEMMRMFREGKIK